MGVSVLRILKMDDSEEKQKREAAATLNRGAKMAGRRYAICAV
jgi:hypothetical protein